MFLLLNSSTVGINLIFFIFSIIVGITCTKTNCVSGKARIWTQVAWVLEPSSYLAHYTASLHSCYLEYTTTLYNFFLWQDILISSLFKCKCLEYRSVPKLVTTYRLTTFHLEYGISRYIYKGLTNNSMATLLEMF